MKTVPKGIEVKKNVMSKNVTLRTLGPVSDLEKHLPTEWWKFLFNSVYLKTDGDVVEHRANTVNDVDLLLKVADLKPSDRILDLCCGQGRHSIELARRGYGHVIGVDRSRYLIRLARKRAREMGVSVQFSEGDARNVRLPEHSRDCVYLMGNSFGYFEREEDDVHMLKSICKVLKSEGKLVLDIVDGEWMKRNFEPRSWEWIDQNYFVNRERSIAADGRRIISREIISHSEKGVIADQFYAERLYSFEEIKALLEKLNFTNIRLHGQVNSESTRDQDLGMMAQRLFIVAIAPPVKEEKATAEIKVAVVMGDHRLPDPIKKNGKFNDEDMHTIQMLKDNLKTLKKFSFQYVNNHKTLIKDLSELSCDFVFNLCDEGYMNNAFHELHVPAVMDMMKIPYTGADVHCLSVCYNKAFVRAIAKDMDIPVPMETFYNPLDYAANLPSIFPALLKPNFGDSSMGITQKAVVNSAEELISYLNYLRDIMPQTPVLVQEFLSGREFSVGVIGNPGRFHVLPILQVDYSGLPKNLPPILSYESKWDPQSPYWKDIRYHEAILEDESAKKLIDYSCLLFERLRCRDYARFDFREDASGQIKLLEVNPNPGWCWDGKLNFMAEKERISYAQLLEMILTAAKERISSQSLGLA